MNRNCEFCGKKFISDRRNLKRGWGLCCSKRCAAKKREIERTGYNANTVEYNNIRRMNWNRRRQNYIFDFSSYDIEDDEFYNERDF